jgi:hypothetical protein
MTEGPVKGITDLLGIQPVAKAVEKATDAALNAAEAVLSRVCLPAAEEFGLLLRDRVSNWRAHNFITFGQKLEQRLAENKVPQGAHAHPRLVHSIVEQGTWVEDSTVQDLWAGLLSSSCTESGDDDSNLLFVNLLGSLTKLQARVLKYACEEAQKVVTPGGLIQAMALGVTFEKLCEVAGENDIHRLDRELDHLRGLGLIRGGLYPEIASFVPLTPEPLALHMYVRCQGSRATPAEFFKITQPAAPAPQSPQPPLGQAGDSAGQPPSS